MAIVVFNTSVPIRSVFNLRRHEVQARELSEKENQYRTQIHATVCGDRPNSFTDICTKLIRTTNNILGSSYQVTSSQAPAQNYHGPIPILICEYDSHNSRTESIHRKLSHWLDACYVSIFNSVVVNDSNFQTTQSIDSLSKPTILPLANFLDYIDYLIIDTLAERTKQACKPLDQDDTKPASKLDQNTRLLANYINPQKDSALNYKKRVELIRNSNRRLIHLLLKQNPNLKSALDFHRVIAKAYEFQYLGLVHIEQTNEKDKEQTTRVVDAINAAITKIYQAKLDAKT
ncbi:MAG: hypothetical protein O2962_00640 [Cyanobacteria bacterium]|nr:hypothetical protein [Cyanobacteriota bacterium]